MTDNWRLLLALAMTIAVLLIWNSFFMPEQQPVQYANKTGVQKERVQRDEDVQPKRDMQPREEELPKAGEEAAGSIYTTSRSGKRIQVETPLYKAEINSQSGILEHFVLKNYRESIKEDASRIDLISPDSLAQAPLGLYWKEIPLWNQVKWEVQGENLYLDEGEKDTLTLRGEYKGIELLRKLTFTADNYYITEEIQLDNTSDALASGTLSLNLVTEQLVTNESRFNRTSVIHYAGKGLEKESDTDDLEEVIRSEDKVFWGGVASNYFMLAALSLSKDMYFQASYENEVYRVNLAKQLGLNPKETQKISTAYYFGPKSSTYLEKVPNNLKAAIHYGFLDIIAKPLIKLLQFFYKFVGNYGIAIIMLTIVIKILFWPLSHKSYKSMEKMKKIQPMMKKLKEQYKDDRQQMNKELMRLYKTYKVNPAGGCLPMLLQIPVFIGLYEALLGGIELRHASFIPNIPFTDIVWLADLSAKDPLYVTPIVMGLSMFLQQKLSPTAGDPTQAKIMLIMPVFLTFIFLNFPCGLVVYFITNNVLSIAQQWWMLRKA